MINDLKEYFLTIEEYKDITICEKYDKNTTINFPMITIYELENTENERYTNDGGEQISNLGYQIEAYSDNTPFKSANENVRSILKYVDQFLKTPKYICLSRMGNTPIFPMNDDQNIMFGSNRYICSLDIYNNIIYRR